MKKKSVFLAILIVAVLAAAELVIFAGVTGASKYEYETLVQCAPTAVRKIEVELENVQLDIFGGWREQFEVDAAGRAVKNVTAELSDGKLTIREKETNFFTRLWRRSRDNDYVAIWLPEGFEGSFVIENENADVMVADVNGAWSHMSLEAENGEIIINETHLARLEIEGETGEICLMESVIPILNVKTDSGDVFLYDVECGDLTVFARSGDVDGNVTANRRSDVVTTNGENTLDIEN